MIVTNVIGGLGNQMFQYACGFALALRTGAAFAISTDLFEGYHLHNGFELPALFRVAPREVSRAELRGLLGWQSSRLVRRLVGRPSMHALATRNFVAEPSLNYWSGIRDVRSPAYLHGYWQSEEYFSDAKAQIRTQFEFRDVLDGESIGVVQRMRAGECVSIHVRRGDYLSKKNQGLFHPCTMDYYRRAITLMRERNPNMRIFAFSDDPVWVAEHLMPLYDGFEIVAHNRGRDSAKDMMLMAAADHNIVANSSFSWWAAWLNKSSSKLVVAPEKWYSDDSITTVVPPTWIRL